MDAKSMPLAFTLRNAGEHISTWTNALLTLPTETLRPLEGAWWDSDTHSRDRPLCVKGQLSTHLHQNHHPDFQSESPVGLSNTFRARSLSRPVKSDTLGKTAGNVALKQISLSDYNMCLGWKASLNVFNMQGYFVCIQIVKELILSSSENPQFH